ELGDWASNVDALGIGIKTQTTNFTYAVNVSGAKASTVANEGVPVVSNLRPYTGQVYTQQSTTTSETTTVAILCVNNTTATAAITGIGTDCGSNAVAVSK
ncbi:MAG TPA: type IV pilin-like G/H family protein, partial [Kamptonema sp.]|nr:type IV pilin-like G/H family protein [Kamptonema sp.]